MSYQVKQQDGKYNVVNDSGEVVKSLNTKAEALDHVRSLFANVKDTPVAEFSMSIVKATSKDGAMKWRSVNSDVEADVYGERMSLELFSDFNRRILNEEPVPEPFASRICEDEWCGGMPYMSIAHYKTGSGKVNVPGQVDRVYVDGKALKSTGTLFDTPLGKAVYKSLEKDLTEKSDNPVRISIGFLDLEHSHGDRFTFVRESLEDKCPLCKEGIGDKIYKKGHLVHLALTRVPANPRTEMELEQKSMTTKRQDAESIIEDEEVLKGLELKSQTENDILVLKKDDTIPADVAEKHNIKQDENTVVSLSVTDTVPVTISIPANPTVPATSGLVQMSESPLDKSLAALSERIATLKSQGLKGEQALAELQKNFDELGSVVKAEFTPQPSPQELAKHDLEITLRSALQEMLPQALAQVVAPLQSEMAELRALSQKTPIKKEEPVTQRSLSVNLVQKAAIEKLVAKSRSQFEDIARASVGLQ